MKEIDYTGDEVRALIAPLLGFEPEDICGYAIVGLTHDGQVQAAGNGDTYASVRLLQYAQMFMVVAPAPGAMDPAEPAEPNPLAEMPADVDALLRDILGDEEA